MYTNSSAGSQQAMVKNHDPAPASLVKLGDQGFEPADPPSDAGILGKYVTWFSCYMIKIPRFFDEDLRTELQHARSQLDENARFRDSIRLEIQDEYRKKLFAAKTEEDAAREARNAKQQEKESILSKINLMKIKSSVDWIKERIHEIERTLNHETIPLKQEKEYIQEMKKLKQQLHELEPRMGPRAELEKIFNQKDQIEEQFKTLNKELQSLKAAVLRAQSNTRAARNKYNSDYLEEEFIKAKSQCQKSYEYIQYLKCQLTERNKPSYQYREDRRIATKHVTAGDKDSLQDLCNQQVEEVMKRWNQDIEFRKNYIKAKERNTLTRLRTLDGHSLGPNDSNQLDKLEKLTTSGGIMNEEPEKVEKGIQQTREVEEWSRKEELSRTEELKRKEEAKVTRTLHDEDQAKAEQDDQKKTEKRDEKKNKKKKIVGSMDAKNAHVVDVLPELGDKQAANEVSKTLLGQRTESEEDEKMIRQESIVKEMMKRHANKERVEGEYEAMKEPEIADALKEEHLLVQSTNKTDTENTKSGMDAKAEVEAQYKADTKVELREKKRKKKKNKKKKKVGSMYSENAHLVDVLPELGGKQAANELNKHQLHKSEEAEEMIRRQDVVEETMRRQAESEPVEAEYKAQKEPEVVDELKEAKQTRTLHDEDQAKAEEDEQKETEVREKRTESEEDEDMIRQESIVKEAIKRQADEERVEAEYEALKEPEIADELKEEHLLVHSTNETDAEDTESGMEAKTEVEAQYKADTKAELREKNKSKKKKVRAKHNASGGVERGSALNVVAPLEPSKKVETTNIWNLLSEADESIKMNKSKKKKKKTAGSKKTAHEGFEEGNVKIVAPPEPSQQPETTKGCRCLPVAHVKQTWTSFLLAILLDY